MTILLIVLSWLVCAFLAYGLMLGLFYKDGGEVGRADRWFCFWLSICGSLITLIVMVMIWAEEAGLRFRLY